MRPRTLREQRAAEGWLRYTSGLRTKPPGLLGRPRLMGFAIAALAVVFYTIYFGTLENRRSPPDRPAFSQPLDASSSE